MPGTSTPAPPARSMGAASKACDILTAVSMTIGRGAAARAVAEDAG